MQKLAIISTHPIQYNAPLFQLLQEKGKINIKVFYTWGESVLDKKYDPGFGKIIEWDIPLLNGYDYEFIENLAKDKGSHHFKGIINPGLIKAIEAWAPNAILVYGWSYKSHYKALQYFKNKIPVLFRGDSTLLDKRKGIIEFIRKKFLRHVYRNIDLAFYTGKNNYAYFKYAGLKEDQLVYAPHVVNNRAFECNSAACINKAMQLKQELNIPAQDMVFLFAGKLEPKKDPSILLAAFTEASIPQSQLLIVGNGALEKELKDKFSNNSQIHFLDFQNQSVMPSIYQLADVFVLPSKGPGETWGLAINEAMANGKAIIASDKCGAAVDLIKPGLNGFIFPAENKVALIDCMKQITKDETVLRSMKIKSKKMIADFNLAFVAEAIEGAVNKKYL